MVLHAGTDSGASSQAALATLCRQYWYPLYVYLRHQGKPHHESEDCVQGFFAHLLAGHGMARACPQRGRFRTFLLTAMRNFQINEWEKMRAAKRGGGAPVLHLDDLTEAQQRFTEYASAAPPERAYDRAWARQLVTTAMEDLRNEYVRRGSPALFAEVSPLLWGESASYLDRATRLGMTLTAFTTAVHRLRRRLADRLRAHIADTVPESTDIDEELRYLISILT